MRLTSSTSTTFNGARRRCSEGAWRAVHTATRARLGASVLVTAGLLGVALLVTGCGGSTVPGVAHLGSTATASGAAAPSAGGSSGGGGSSSSGGGGAGEEHSEAVIGGGGSAGDQQKMVAFAQCMRAHGVPNFPEPAEGKLILKGGPNSGPNPGSPQFQSARRACGHLMPQHAPSPAQSAEFQAKALKFSSCMREHGLPNFPDPKFSGGGVQLSINKGSGIDPRTPRFQAARKACQSQLPGGGPGGSVSGGGPGGPP
jgi:hypothetical protein